MKTFKEYVNQGFKTTLLKHQIQQASEILIDLFTVASPQDANRPALFAAMRYEWRQHSAHVNSEKFWLDHDSPLFPWLKGHGVRAYPGKIPVYAQGGAGRCYFLGKKVVKMSANRVEANVAKMLAGREDVPTPVIDVLFLENNMYAILQHWVDTANVPKQIREAADYLTALIDDNPEMSGFPTNPAVQQLMCAETLQTHGGDPSILPHMIMMMEVLIKIYNATGFKHNDAGPTNIGMLNGKVVVPDLGPNEDEDFDQLDALSKIRKNRNSLGLPPHQSI